MSEFRTSRALIAAVAMSLAVACGAEVTGAQDTGATVTAPPATPGQPAGTVVVAAGTDFASALQRVQDAVTAGGGTVAAVVDHAAAARAVGVEIPPSTVVLGSTAAEQVPLLRADQRAAANLPQRYLLRQGTGGAVTLTYNGADYVAAVSGVTRSETRTALRDATMAVVDRAAPTTGTPVGSPLVGVTPANYLLTVFGSADVPATVARLRRNADRKPSTSIAVLDMVVGSTDPGPPIRPTSLVLVSTPEAEAPLLAAAPSFGLELPMRYVVWLDDQDRTLIGYPDVRRLAARHGIPADDPSVARMVIDADRLAKLAAGIIE